MIEESKYFIKYTYRGVPEEMTLWAVDPEDAKAEFEYKFKSSPEKPVILGVSEK